jgi:hypothetical protein
VNDSTANEGFCPNLLGKIGFDIGFEQIDAAREQPLGANQRQPAKSQEIIDRRPGLQFSHGEWVSAG